jgi:AcrR family transcriptional regulator
MTTTIQMGIVVCMVDLAAPELPALTPGARRLLDAASALFYDRGVHAVGVDTIAEAAGVTKKTLYDRFGSKEVLVVSYLQHRDARWRAHLAAELALVPDPGPARVLTVFDATLTWAPDNSPKGCGVINARAEVGRPDEGGPVLPELTRQKRWMLGLFADLLAEAGLGGTGRSHGRGPDGRGPDDDVLARQLMLLHEGALVTLGMATFPRPVEAAREVAAALLAGTAATTGAAATTAAAGTTASS